MEEKVKTRGLYTENPVALRYLMSETLYAVDSVGSVDSVDSVDEQALSEPLSPVPDLTFYGGNRSGILFISPRSSGPGEHTLPEAEMLAFEKILAALQLTTEDISLIHVPKDEALSGARSLPQLVDFFTPKIIVVLGTDLRMEGLNSELHEVQQRGNYRFLHTYSFHEMGEDVEKKRLFWGKLKAIWR